MQRVCFGVPSGGLAPRVLAVELLSVGGVILPPRSWPTGKFLPPALLADLISNGAGMREKKR